MSVLKAEGASERGEVTAESFIASLFGSYTVTEAQNHSRQGRNKRQPRARNNPNWQSRNSRNRNKDEQEGGDSDSGGSDEGSTDQGGENE